MSDQASNLRWLIRVRWGEIAAQLLVFIAGDRLRHRAPLLVPLLLTVGVQLATNVACALWTKRAVRVPEWVLVGVMALDSVLLTVLLLLTGGDSNPFAVLYLVNISLAGILFRPRWTWALMALSTACLSTLFIARQYFPELESGDDDPIESRLREMWIAFGIASGLIVYFVQRTIGMVRERERAVELARQSGERREKLASLATLAAGAAHELSTPLSTIALAAKELERSLQRKGGPPGATEDAKLIREQVERCRGILSQMAADAGESMGEPPEPLSMERVIESALELIDDPARVQVTVAPELAGQRVIAPPRALAYAVKAVMKNAIQASPPGTQVTLRATAEGPLCRIEVVDQGAGMSPETLVRAGEPFFTTKEPGRGMGLGLFLTRSLVEQLGGRFELASTPSKGTSAALLLPVSTPG